MPSIFPPYTITSRIMSPAFKLSGESQPFSQEEKPKPRITNPIKKRILFVITRY